MDLLGLPEPTSANLYPPFRHVEFFPFAALHSFEAAATGFSSVNAAWLADASTLAYDPDVTYVCDRFQNAGFEMVETFRGRSSQAYLAANRSCIVVAFRGTQVYRAGGSATLGDVLADWVTDVRAGMVESGHGGLVHDGFKAALDQIWQPLMETVTRLRKDNPVRTLWLTGHSLGAALATLSAQRLKHAAGLYTYGSPLVGDAAFCERSSLWASLGPTSRMGAIRAQGHIVLD